MKMELKHLAPYLPYSLKVKWHPEDITPHIYEMAHLSNGKINQILSFTCCSPILRPLQDLNKNIIVNGSEVNAFKYSKFYCPNTFKSCVPKLKDVDYKIMQKLFEWHFDVFGLIKKGLAIDINTLENEQH